MDEEIRFWKLMMGVGVWYAQRIAILVVDCHPPPPPPPPPHCPPPPQPWGGKGKEGLRHSYDASFRHAIAKRSIAKENFVSKANCKPLSHAGQGRRILSMQRL